MTPTSIFRGSDRDAGAVRMSAENAARADVADFTEFTHHAVSDLMRPEGRSGLVIVNPPYGARIGDVAGLRAVYGALGKTLLARFSGWRVGMVTSEPALAYGSGLPFTAGPRALHGGLKVQLFQTGRLK
jgi:putative N6-adenine-specific DNA methylase